MKLLLYALYKKYFHHSRAQKSELKRKRRQGKAHTTLQQKAFSLANEINCDTYRFCICRGRVYLDSGTTCPNHLPLWPWRDFSVSVNDKHWLKTFIKQFSGQESHHCSVRQRTNMIQTQTCFGTQVTALGSWVSCRLQGVARNLVRTLLRSQFRGYRISECQRDAYFNFKSFDNGK